MARINAEKFAQAYIQTLPHTKSPSEFENDDEYDAYMDTRFRDYLSEYVHVIERIEEMGTPVSQLNDLPDEEV
ncbi:hypothetical protein J4760_04230 [Salinicoccus sp. ID82-1]|uniref:hypothetical protein n=1 Tax=Salinicoccus sp. ID82-1 TaxID=2820269 RepID=UPI001F183356|nr:hypothetical protein [Salinicoccus sp. ID82-1]MCG1009260.1 hypothetical protein [Salinicoccus sp. ID82-1]